MLAAHMDEIGFYVSYIDDKGFLRVNPVGGFDVRNLFARQVVVHPSNGGELIGVMNPATKPIHLLPPEERKKIPVMSDFAIDLGLAADEVKGRVRIGDMVTLRQEFCDLGEVVTGKAMDNRASCWIQVETLKRLKKPACEVAAVFSVQEEVGLRGAVTSAHHLQPEIGIALDVTLAVDTPGGGEHPRVSKLGDGVALKVMDSASISTRWLLDDFIALAEEKSVPYQLEVLPLGGTDAGAIQLSRGGVPSITLSTPTRYVHTVTEMVAKRDLEAAVTLLTAYLERKD
jgi:putative aminopeptidase FrvX